MMKQGMPLPGVNVFIKGTTVGTVTDMNGNYSLVVPEVMGMEVMFILYWQTDSGGEIFREPVL